MKIKLRSIFILGVIFCFINNFSNAQEAILKGTLLDGSDGSPLIAGTIRVGENGTISKLDGTYEITTAPGRYLVSISYVGFVKQDTSIMLSPGENNLIIFLLPSLELLDQAVVSTSKYAKSIAKSTVSIEVVKPSFLNSNNTESVEQIFQKVPGVSMVGDQINIRGGAGFSYGAGSRVLLLLDDVPILQADAGYPNWNDIPIENLAQIEILKGAASSLYGSAALNGAINVKTAYARSEPSTILSSFLTSYFSPKDKNKKWWNDYKYSSVSSISHRQKFGKLDFVGSLFYRNSDSYNADSYDKYGRLFSKFNYRISDLITTGAQLNYNKGITSSFFYWKDAESGALQASESTISISDRVRFSIDPYISIYTKSGFHHKVNTRWFHIDNDVNNGQANMSDLIYLEYQFQKKFEKQNILFTGGLVSTFVDVEAELYGDSTFTSDNYAAYVQVEKELFKNLNISAGMRYESFIIRSPENVGGFYFPGGEFKDSKPVFRFGANFEVSDYSFLRASWGQGFRYPTLAEKFIQTTFGSTKISPNPDLDSESGWSAEIGLKQGLSIFSWKGYLDVSGFWSEYQDMMEFVFGGSQTGFQSKNIGNTIIKGWEISLNGQSKIGNIPITMISGYTYLDPQFKDFTENNRLTSSVDYNILKYRRKHSFKFDIEASINKLFIGFSGIRESHMEAIDAIFEIAIPGLKNYRIANNNGYTTFDTRIGWGSDHLRSTLMLRNIFNQEYTLRPGRIEPPRNITLRLDYTL